MERKRKLPARAAARVEQANKKRMGRTGAAASTPRKSPTPEAAPAPEPEPVPVEEAPPPLPKSITAGQPLPTVDSPQPEDISGKEYQSVSESGVLGEALTRSRQKWIGENMFEKWWSKPVKRKGVTIEDPKNPPKHSMTKLGAVEISVGPHLLDATVFAIKDGPWIREPSPPQSDVRPIIQYGPPNGIMPPPQTQKQSTPKPSPPTESAASTSAPVSTAVPAQPATTAAAQTQVKTQTPEQTLAPTPAQLPTQPQAVPQVAPQVPAPAPAPAPVPSPAQAHIPAPPPPIQSHSTLGAPPMAAVPGSRPPIASPRGMESVLNAVPRPPPTIPHAISQPPRPAPSPSVPAAGPTATRPAGAPAPKPAPGTDPIILTLAEKAGEDPHLRVLMKRVAQGDAAKHELERFQAIIDAITAESKRKGSPVGPSADRLLVDGRTVRYFADEVRAILDIVLSSNPNQTSADLRPPQGSDPLVVALVKAALDDVKTSDMVRRIASNKPLFSDATELKVILDRLRTKLANEREQQQKRAQPAQLATASPVVKAGGSLNGDAAPSPTTTPTTAQQQPPAQQALRSKGPPKVYQPKSDVMAVCLEFFGGSGDRFLFPKFSIVEDVPSPKGQVVVVSFLIVRKGSMSEYPAADPELDYYQPVTISIFAPTGRYLDHLFRVVAPQEEVRRYMDDIMDNMTRAEYVLLAMRLPRAEGKDGEESQAEEKEKDKTPAANGAKQGETEPAAEKGPAQQLPPSVLWGTSKSTKPARRELSPPRKRLYAGFTDDDDDQQYQSFVASISRKEPKEA
ncbi:hypothetical protein B0T16DRAFT_324224 [Cercophora newfieldiana]|uniref:SWR1-complex protein 3 domain-containing protein n=1 Tax=Cercophora newfieldiana TaxID=92897 RepID=A0AA39YAM9_9PEZI|nr:hypothetical protein B0T16DRAFT_324224 [Cercophora newfieldiana]